MSLGEVARVARGLPEVAQAGEEEGLVVGVDGLVAGVALGGAGAGVVRVADVAAVGIEAVRVAEVDGVQPGVRLLRGV